MVNRPPGKYFDELNLGDHFTTPSRTVTEADIVNFAGISGDFNEVHTSEEFAKRQPYGGRIAHGMLTVAISAGLVARGQA
jgi:acyl dehydratase